MARGGQAGSGLLTALPVGGEYAFNESFVQRIFAGLVAHVHPCRDECAAP